MKNKRIKDLLYNLKSSSSQEDSKIWNKSRIYMNILIA